MQKKRISISLFLYNNVRELPTVRRDVTMVADYQQMVEQKITGNVHQGVNVRKVRQIMGLKQEVLAEKLGITQPIVSRIESRRVIEPDTLMKIANILCAY